METPEPGKIRLLLICRGRIGDAALLGKRTTKRSKNNWDLLCKWLNGESGGKSFAQAGAEANLPISECAVQSNLDGKLASMKSSDMS